VARFNTKSPRFNRGVKFKTHRRQRAFNTFNGFNAFSLEGYAWACAGVTRPTSRENPLNALNALNRLAVWRSKFNTSPDVALNRVLNRGWLR
jgi:hypothetical protein